MNGWGPWGPCWRYTCLPSVVCTCAVAVAQWCCARIIQLLRTANRNLRHSTASPQQGPRILKATVTTVVDGVTDGRYIARRTGVRHSHTVSISDLENGPSLSRGLTLLAPRVHPWPCRCSSGNRRALQGAAGRCRALQDDQIVCPDRTPYLGALRRSSQPHLTVPFTQPSTMPSPRNPRHPALHSTLLAENSWMSCRAAASSALRLSLTFSASAAAASAPA